jgi:glutathione S-transferase
MPEFTLYTGYANISTWSMRGWLAMKKSGAPFADIFIRYRLKDDKARLMTVSPTGRVPVLVHERKEGTVRVWDSIAIGEYVAELFPEKKLWPEDPAVRALARSISAEMHSGFMPMRHALSMDLTGRHSEWAEEAPGAAENIARVKAIWRECREKHGTNGGPFLFGGFTIADAMYAPVAFRFRTYGVPLDSVSQAYADTIFADPDVKEWEKKAEAQPMDPPTP